MLISKKLMLIVLIALTIPSHSWCQSKAFPIVDSLLELDSVTASLNDSVWHGRVYAFRESSRIRGNKTLIYLNINFSAYSPYTTYSSRGEITDTTTQLVASQVLNISNMPLLVGTFKLSTYNDHQNPKMSVRYDLIEGGDAISDSYYLKKDINNRVQIIKYDPKLSIITGAFELSLISRSGETLNFKNGVFKAKVALKDR